MNKQELIEKLKGEQQRCDIAGSDMYNYITPSEPSKIAIKCQAQARAYEHAITMAQQLNEPNQECELISNEYNICSCGYNLIKEIVVGCDTEDCECGNAVVHQVFWTDKYMNYCPNCGCVIKRERSDL